MKVSPRRLVSWALAILVVVSGAAHWSSRHEAKQARQVYYAQESRYNGLLAMALKDSASVRTSDLDAAAHARNLALAEHEKRWRKSDMISLCFFVAVGAHLLFGWISDRVDKRKNRANAA
jgi:hypothetical protein